MDVGGIEPSIIEISKLMDTLGWTFYSLFATFTENTDDRCVTTPTPTPTPSCELCTFIYCHQVIKSNK